MYNYTPDNGSFLEIEIGKIKKVRNLLNGVFMLLFFICFGFFLYVFLDKWWLTSDKLTFFYRSLPLLCTLFVYFGVLFGGLGWIVYRKNQKFISALQNLNHQDLGIYRQYTSRLVRIYATIAPYLFFEQQLLLFPLWGSKRIPIDQIHRIETKIIENYRGPNTFRVYFYTESSKIQQLTMSQRGAFDFIQEQLLKEIPNLVIIARNH